MLDLAIIVSFFIICVVVGFKHQKINNFSDFITIPTEMRTSFMLFATIFASAIGSGSTIGLTQKIYNGQYEYIIAYIFSLSWLIVIARYLIPRIVNFNGQTIGDIFYSAYGRTGQKTVGLFSVILSMGHFSAQVTGCGLLFKNFLAIEPLFGIAISYVIIVGYSAFGGLRAVIKTDAVQLIIMAVGLVILFCTIFVMQPIDNVFSTHTVKPINKTMSSFIIDSAILTLTFIVMTFYPHFVQRLLLTKDVKIIQKSLIQSIYGYFIFVIMISFVSIKSQILFQDLEGQLLFSTICNNLATGVKGIVIASLIAALMSTADSDLNAAVTCLCKDLLNEKKYSDSKMLVIARVSTCILGVIFVAIALSFKNILDLLIFVASFWSPVILVPFIGILYDKIITVRELLIMITFSVFSASWWNYSYHGQVKIPGILVGCLISLIIFIVFIKVNARKLNKC